MKELDIDRLVRAMKGDLYGRWSEKVGGESSLYDVVERVVYYAEEQMQQLHSAEMDELVHAAKYSEQKYLNLARYMVECSRKLSDISDKLGAEADAFEELFELLGEKE